MLYEERSLHGFVLSIFSVRAVYSIVGKNSCFVRTRYVLTRGRRNCQLVNNKENLLSIFFNQWLPLEKKKNVITDFTSVFYCLFQLQKSTKWKWDIHTSSSRRLQLIFLFFTVEIYSNSICITIQS